jgi:hypothetical protein
MKLKNREIIQLSYGLNNIAAAKFDTKTFLVLFKNKRLLAGVMTDLGEVEKKLAEDKETQSSEWLKVLDAESEDIALGELVLSDLQMDKNEIPFVVVELLKPIISDLEK